MKQTLPDGHNLPHIVVENDQLLPRADDGALSITDAQFEALASGVARGQSMLVVAPTSTGKTLVGVWALVSWLDADPNRTVVYLVTHRALARQKFDELRELLCGPACFDDLRMIVLATGDTVQDGEGGLPDDPLSAPILVATYEKYLGLLAGTASHTNLSHSAIVCDEVQILGDEKRGRNIEILLTVLKTATWGQLVALSAVIDETDASELADWLSVDLVRLTNREKHLRYECRFPKSIVIHDTSTGTATQRERQGAEATDTIGILHELYSDSDALPIVVFCMTRRRVYDGARAFAERRGVQAEQGQDLLPELGEPTEAAVALSRYARERLAFHTADLLEEERLYVERMLQNGQLDVVFATTTLAAGVNFPFRTAVFDGWRRWNTRLRFHEPIPNSEFQNMAGRAGRMGFEHASGRVIFCSQDDFRSKQTVRSYLDPDHSGHLIPRVAPRSFNQIALQLIATGICRSQSDIEDFLLGSFSAVREQDRNVAGLSHWSDAISQAVDGLIDWGFVI